jgi:hypothetical protein
MEEGRREHFPLVPDGKAPVATRAVAARPTLSGNAGLTWTVEASSQFEAMTLYYGHQGWGVYATDYSELDRQTYAERGWE